MKTPTPAITESSSREDMLAYIEQLEKRLEIRTMSRLSEAEDGEVRDEPVHLTPEERAEALCSDLDGVGARNATIRSQDEVIVRQALHIAGLEQILTSIASLAPDTTDMSPQHEMADLAAQGLEGGRGALDFVGEAVARRAWRHGLNAAMRMIPEDVSDRELLVHRNALAAEVKRRDRFDRFPADILAPFKPLMDELEERVPMAIIPNLTF